MGSPSLHLNSAGPAQTLRTDRAHGHAITQAIESRSVEVLQVGDGSLYPSLQRLLKDGLIAAKTGLLKTSARRASTGSRPRANGSY